MQTDRVLFVRLGLEWWRPVNRLLCHDFDREGCCCNLRDPFRVAPPFHQVVSNWDNAASATNLFDHGMHLVHELGSAAFDIYLRAPSVVFVVFAHLFLASRMSRQMFRCQLCVCPMLASPPRASRVARMRSQSTLVKNDRDWAEPVVTCGHHVRPRTRDFGTNCQHRATRLLGHHHDSRQGQQRMNRAFEQSPPRGPHSRSLTR